MSDVKIGEDFWFGAKDNLSISLIAEGLQLYSDLKNKMQVLEGDSPIFLDTNVLTYYYKISFSEREKLRNFIEKYQSRIVLTRRVEREFISNRTGIIRQFNGRLKDSLVDKFDTVKKSVQSLKEGRVNGLNEYINDKVIKNDFPELSAELKKVYDDFQELIKKAFEKSKLGQRIEVEESKIEKIIEDATKENNAHEKNDKIIGLLANISICDNLDSDEIAFLKEKYQELLKVYETKKGDEKSAWQYTFPGCGEKKGKEDPTGDFIIFHEMLKHIKNKNCNAIFLTNDISKQDWLDTNKEQYTHYIESAYSNTNQMVFIFHAQDVLGVSYENVFEEVRKRPAKVNLTKLLEELKHEETERKAQEHAEEDHLSDSEQVVVFTIAGEQSVAFEPVSAYAVGRELEKSGFHRLTVNILIRRLVDKKMVQIVEEEDYNGHPYLAYQFTRKGETWILENFVEGHEYNNLGNNTDDQMVADDDLPF